MTRLHQFRGRDLLDLDAKTRNADAAYRERIDAMIVAQRRAEMPLVRGGQGRSDADLSRRADICLWIAYGAIAIAAIVAIMENLL